MDQIQKCNFDETETWETTVWCELLARKQEDFFPQKSIIFLQPLYFAGLLPSTHRDLWMVSLAKKGPQACKRLPQGQVWSSFFRGSTRPIGLLHNDIK